MTNPILYWNEVALEANRVDHTKDKEQAGPTLSSRALAIVHLAMYDAYAGVKADPIGFPHYLPTLPPPSGAADINAAVAGAAQATLSALYPKQKATFDAKNLGVGFAGTPDAIQGGYAYGLLVAQALLKDRKDDPRGGDDGYSFSIGRGAHRVDPDNPGQGFQSPFYGKNSRCFAVTSRHDLDAPPQPGTSEYNTALQEVRAKGIAPELFGTIDPHSAKRTAEESIIGVYWGFDGSKDLGTPPRLYNQIVRAVAVERGIENDSDQLIRLFARVNTAMADAGILAWEQKYKHNLWRPVVGIREHDPSMGPTGAAGNHINNDCDASWLPFGAPNSNQTAAKNFTPNFPAYPSGHATFGAAAFHTTRLFFDPSLAHNRADDGLFTGSFVSEELNGSTTDNKGTVRPKHVRNFSGGLWQMIVENGRSRVFLGVHWIFDAFAPISASDRNPDFGRKVGGVPLGLNIAEDIAANGLQRSSV